MQAGPFDRTRILVRRASAGVFAACLLLVAAPAHAQLPAVGGAVNTTTQIVTDTAGQVGQTVTDTGSKVGEAVTDTGTKVGDSVGGTSGETVKKTTTTTGTAVKNTSSAAGSTIEKAAETITGTVKGTGDGGTKVVDDLLRGVGGTVGETLDELTGAGKVRGGKKKKGADEGSAPGTLVRVPDRVAAGGSSSTGAIRLPLAPLSSQQNPTQDTGVTFGDVIRRALETVKRFAFPLALTLLVLAYLAVNGWFDRRDPKLALAAVDPDADLLRFE